jgi:hypothetical protein
MLIKKPHNFLFSLFFVFTLVMISASFCLASPSAEELLKRKGFVWKSAASEHFRFHFEPVAGTENRIENLRRSQEEAYVKNLRLLKINVYPYQTDIFVVASRERMKLLTGDETNGAAYPDTKVVCFILNEKLYGWGSHELMHVMAGNVWGKKFKPWINEGFATYSDDIWYGCKLHDLNKYLWQRKKLIPLEKLIEDFLDYSDMAAYPQAGSFVKYLYEQYGADKVRELWKGAAVKDLKRVLGKDVGTLEKEWHSELMKAEATNVKYEFLSPRR